MLTYMYTDNCDMLTIGKHLQIEDFIENGKAEVNSTIDFIELGAGDEKKSAFQIYSSQKKNRNKACVDKSQKGDKKVNDGRQNVLQALQDMARKFGVKTLTKKLDAVKLSSKSDFDMMFFNVALYIFFSITCYKLSFDTILKDIYCLVHPFDMI